jgi:hypothetical protein
MASFALTIATSRSRKVDSRLAISASLVAKRFSKSCLVAVNKGAARDSVSFISALQLGQTIVGSAIALSPSWQSDSDNSLLTLAGALRTMFADADKPI